MNTHRFKEDYRLPRKGGQERTWVTVVISILYWMWSAIVFVFALFLVLRNEIMRIFKHKRNDNRDPGACIDNNYTGKLEG